MLMFDRILYNPTDQRMCARGNVGDHLPTHARALIYIHLPTITKPSPYLSSYCKLYEQSLFYTFISLLINLLN